MAAGGLEVVEDDDADELESPKKVTRKDSVNKVERRPSSAIESPIKDKFKMRV